MTKVPGTNVPVAASSGEDVGVYPGGGNRPELEFTIANNTAATGTSDRSPNTPEFRGPGASQVTASTVWDQQALIASANFMPLLAIGDTGGGGVNILGSNVDISNLSSKEYFRATNLGSPGAITSGFTTTGAVLGEYVRGFTDTPPAAPTSGVVVSQTVPSAPVEFFPMDYETGLDWL